MKPRTLALATFVALFGASASFGAFANDPSPIDDTQPISGSTLDPADPATTPDELYATDQSLAADTAADELEDDHDHDDDADDDDTVDSPTDDAMAAAAAADGTATATTDNAALQAQRDVALGDDNRNGALEAGEVSSKSSLNQSFAELDTDNNGSLSITEYESWIAAHPPRDPADGSQATTAGDTSTTIFNSGADTGSGAQPDSTTSTSETLASEEIAGEPGRPSDAGTPDVDSDDATDMTASTGDSAIDEVNEEIGGEEDRPSDAGTPDADLAGDDPDYDDDEDDNDD